MGKVEVFTLKVIQSSTRTTRIIVESLLAALYKRPVVTELMDGYPTSSSDLSEARMGKERFAFGRKLF